jgi:hypothetical protein
MANVSADSTFRFDETFPFKNLVDFGDGKGVDVEIGGKFAHRRELRPVLKLSRKDALLELMLQLHIKRDAAVGIKEKHSVVLK